jgi:hypothetical protein
MSRNKSKQAKQASRDAKAANLAKFNASTVNNVTTNSFTERGGKTVKPVQKTEHTTAPTIRAAQMLDF